MLRIDKPICVAPTADVCGESPLWHAAEQTVYWTDINRFLIHRFDTSDQSVKTWHFDEPVTTLVLTKRNDTLAVALGSRLIFWQPRSDVRRDHGFRLDAWPAVRLNDGRADPRGSLWLGSMRNNVRADGSSVEAGGKDGVLYRIDPDGSVSEWKRGIGISNTLAWSPDRTRFYFADTLANEIYAFDYDQRSGVISQQRNFLTGFSRGLPDGSNVDSKGYLWNCRYEGGCIVRVAPSGEIDQIIEMPATNITSCTFGGEDYKTLYVTTAAAHAPVDDWSPGGLFSFRIGVAGQPENSFLAASSD